MNTLQRVFVRLRVFFKKRMRIFTKHPKRTIFGVVLIVILAVMSILMFATPLFFNATVRFETGEGSVIFDKTIRRGTALPNIENPTYEYNTFGGWYFDKEYTKPYENQKIYSDTVLYAKWNTIFTDEFFIEKSNLINEIFNIDVFTQPLDIIIRDRDMIEEYFDDVPDDIDFMYFIEHSCFSIFACIASPETSKEMLLKLYGIVEKDVIEDGSIDSYNLIRADRAIFLIPYGLENIFFGDIEKAGDYYYTWNNERNAYTLLRYLGDDKVLHIPSEYKNKPIDYISSYAFYSSPVEEVYFSENIKELGFLLFVTSMLKK